MLPWVNVMDTTVAHYVAEPISDCRVSQLPNRLSLSTISWNSSRLACPVTAQSFEPELRSMASHSAIESLGGHSRTGHYEARRI